MLIKLSSISRSIAITIEYAILESKARRSMLRTKSAIPLKVAFAASSTNRLLSPERSRMRSISIRGALLKPRRETTALENI